MRLQEVQPESGLAGRAQAAGIDLPALGRVVPEFVFGRAAEEGDRRSVQLRVAATGGIDTVLDAERVTEHEFLHAHLVPGDDQAKRISVDCGGGALGVRAGERIRDIPCADLAPDGRRHSRCDGGVGSIHRHVPAAGLQGAARERHRHRISGRQEDLRLDGIGTGLPAEQIQACEEGQTLAAPGVRHADLVAPAEPVTGQLRRRLSGSCSVHGAHRHRGVTGGERHQGNLPLAGIGQAGDPDHGAQDLAHPERGQIAIVGQYRSNRNRPGRASDGHGQIDRIRARGDQVDILGVTDKQWTV